MAVQIKTKIKYHLTLKTMNIARRLKEMCAGRQVEKKELWNCCKLAQHVQEIIQLFQINE